MSRRRLRVVAQDVLKQGAWFGSVASDARSFRRPADVENLLPEQIEFFLGVQADAIQRIDEAHSQVLIKRTFKGGRQDSGWRNAIFISLSRKFVRQNVREFRRSRARMSGLRSVVLWPVAVSFYLTGLHRVRATRSGKAILKFVRQNVREFRRSRARMSGLRSVVLWPVAVSFYLTGLHQAISKVRTFRKSGRSE